MKIKRITALVIFLSFFLTSCGASTKWDTKINKEEALTFFQGYWTLHGEFSASELGYYYSEPGFLYGYKLTFFDKKTQKSSVVCNLPNCKHQDESCPAIFIRVDGMQYNNGYLFYVQKDEEQNSYLWRCAADGTNREQLFLLADFNEAYRIDPYIYKNHLFYKLTARNGMNYILYHVDMNDPKNQNGIKEKKLFAQLENPHIFIEDINNTGVLYTIPSSEDNGTNCYEYNYHTGETRTIKEHNKRIRFRYVNNKIMFNSSEGVELFSPDSNTSVIIDEDNKPDNSAQLSYDGKYIYVGKKPLDPENTQEESKIDIYNTEGTFIDSIPIPDTKENLVFHFGDKDYLFLQSQIGQGNKIYIFDKKQIGTDTKEWLVR